MKLGMARPSSGRIRGPKVLKMRSDAGVDVVGLAVGQGHGLGEPLGLVVDAARSDRVDVAPVRLRLRVHLRVAVDLGGRGEHETGVLVAGQAQGVQRADRPHLQRLDRHAEVVDGRRRAGEVQDEVDRAADVDVVGDVRPDQPEAGVGSEVRDVLRGAGEEVVEADDLVATVEQRLAQVGAEEPRAAGDDGTGHALTRARRAASAARPPRADRRRRGRRRRPGPGGRGCPGRAGRRRRARAGSCSPWRPRRSRRWCRR